MPQLDNLTYLPQVFWVTLFFTLWFAISSTSILPAILQNVNTRQLVLEQTGADGENASEGLTEVFNQVIGNSAGNGENERGDRALSVSSSNSALKSSAFLGSTIKGNSQSLMIA
jgi:hypothetical protein|tara:strand:+ start:130 stop:471 length:342 start_codon:yes stop_codon:yes gene_type:complete